MHRDVLLLLGRLATDTKLRQRFAATPGALLRELAEAELELSEIELEALAATPPEAIRAFAEALDARLRKAPLDARSIPDTSPQSTPRNGEER